MSEKNPTPTELEEGTAFDAWIGLSSGFTYVTEDEDGELVTGEYETVFSYVFDFLKSAGDWAGAVNSLIGLIN